MDSELVKRGLHFSRRKKKWIIGVGLVGLSGYGLYRVYHFPSVVRKRRKVLKLLGCLISVAELVSESADTMSIVSKDLKEFLQSDSDEIPNSLKQLAKIAQSREFSGMLVRMSEAMTVGVLRGYREESRGEVGEEGVSFGEKFMDKMMSSAGTGFVSVIVGSFARNLVMGFYANGGVGGDGGNGVAETTPQWVNLMCDDKSKELIADCIKNFVSTAITIYLDKTMSINFYDDLFSGMTNPNHQAKVGDILVSLCNGAVETLVKTSHQVLTSSKSGCSPSCSDSGRDEDEGSVSASNKVLGKAVSLEKVKEKWKPEDSQKGGWLSTVSSTLSVPNNRKFVLDVTGRVTFETIRSLVEFFFWKISEGLKRSFAVIREDVIDRALEIIRYVGAKASIILTICFALFLHILGNRLVVLPA